MNKKGFTLVEVIVSVVLVSVILVSLLTTLVKLRESYTVVHENSDVVIYSSSISRIINNDLIDNNGVRYATCNSTGTECELILGNEKKRKLEILTINSNPEEQTDKNNKIIHENIKSTLRYTDTTEEEKLIYMKTLNLDKYTNTKTHQVTSEGYNFLAMKTDVHEYNSSVDEKTDVLSNISIGIYNGLDTNDKSYNIELYSSARYDYDGVVGSTYKITFNNNDADIAGEIGIDEEYGVGFFKRESSHKKSDIITTIERPEKANLAFTGYYYYTGVGNPTIVVDALGNIVANNRLFKQDVSSSNDYPVVRAVWQECNNGYYVSEKNKCEPIEYTMTFDKRTGTGGSDNAKVKYQTKLPSIQIPSKLHYDFLGYYTSATGGEQYYNSDGSPKKIIYDITTNITLYAQWKARPYKVNYDGNGNTGGSMSPSTHYFDSKSNLTVAGFKKTGYNFLGWSKTKGSSTVDLKDQAEILNLPPTGETITLYAVWGKCGVGTYNNGSTVYCQGCPTGYTSATGATAVTQCYITVPAGKTLTTTNGTTFSNCAAGSYKTQHTVNYGSADTACAACGANQYAVAGSAGCTACASGYTVGVGAGTSASSCTMTVPAGRQVATAGGGISNCPANQYSVQRVINQTQTAPCTGCASGYTVGAGAGTSASSCTMTVPAGRQVTTAGGGISNCPANTWAGSRTINQTQTAGCTACPSGYTVAAGAGTSQSTCKQPYVNCCHYYDGCDGASWGAGQCFYACGTASTVAQCKSWYGCTYKTGAYCFRPAGGYLSCQSGYSLGNGICKVENQTSCGGGWWVC